MPRRPQILVVAGSGRSGTSLLASLTGELGLHIPKPEVKANRSNPRGFGEPRWAVDFHNELLSRVDVAVDDGRPEAWERTDALAGDDRVRRTLRAWLEEQLDEHDRVVLKDPRLAWFIGLYRATADELGADVRAATMLRHPVEVLRSREIAYGTRTTNTTRVIGWVNMMLAVEDRTRDLPRATIRYDDLLADWRSALAQADEDLGLDLLADPSRVEAAGQLVDPTLRRSVAQWSELDVPARTRELAMSVYDAYGSLVGTPAEGQRDVRHDLDALRTEFRAYYDECFEVSRSRTGARVRQERRKAQRQARSGNRAKGRPDVGGTTPRARAPIARPPIARAPIAHAKRIAEAARRRLGAPTQGGA